MTFTRRHFLLSLAATAGPQAAWSALRAWDLADPAPPAEGHAIALAPGRRARVLVVGAGIAGLVAAHELRRADYDVTVVEASPRLGGRNLTVRHGSTVPYQDGTQHTATFDDGQYFNAGPARLPGHHKTILGYCRDFGVELEVLVNSSRGALYGPARAAGGNPVQLRQVVNDSRGYIAEWLAKSTRRGALDAELGPDDRARLLDLLKVYGDLSPEFRYTGSSRAGYAVPPGAEQASGVLHRPLDVATLLNPDLWRTLEVDEAYEWQATMLQPVGGMDRLVDAFARRLGDCIRLGVEAEAVLNTPDGVVLHARTATGVRETLEADHMVLTAPMPVVRGLRNNFSDDFRDALRGIDFVPANKIAWQSPRFWETDHQIYGGISYIEHDVQLVWYPSHGFHGPTGILLGCYNEGDVAAAFARQPLPAQLAASRAAVERLHRGSGGGLSHPFAIAWHQARHSRGAWAGWTESTARHYPLLIRPQGRIHLAGDQVSHLPGWQEGAALSALRAVRAIGAHAPRAT
jgi:monoamine oxidase